MTILTGPALVVLLVGGHPAAQTPGPGTTKPGFTTPPPDELSPRLHLGPTGEILRIWYRRTDFREGGGRVFLTASSQDGWKPLLEIAPKEPGVVTLAPDLAINATGEIAVTYQWRQHMPRSKQIRLARSFDAGKTWTESGTSVDTAARGFSPRAAWGRGRNLVVVWSDERRADRAWDVYARRSLDGGVTWGPEQILSRFPLTLSNDMFYRAELIGDGRDTFWAVWVGLRSGRSRLYLSRSIDGGQTWADPVELSGASQSVFGQRLVRAGERLLLVWQDTVIGARDRIFAVSSSDGGVTWTSPTRVDHLPDDASTGAPGPSAVAPSVVMSPTGEVFVAWHDGRNGRDDIFVGHSLDGGRTWEKSDVRLDMDEPGTAYSRFTAVARASDGRVAVAWADDRAGYEGIYLRVRGTGEHATWGPEMIVAGPTAKRGARAPALVWGKGGSVYVAWEVWDYGLGPEAITKRIDSRTLVLSNK